jgi:TPR repeat protein
VQDARDQGVSAFGNGYFEMAVDPLEYAASQNDFLAQYYLARIYSDNTTARTDHGKAYMLYQRLADEYADIDPDDDRRAPFVAKALTALAGYLRTGLTEIGLNPDPERAAEYLHHAATFFNDEDAQFQLAKVILEGSLQRSDQPRDGAREKLAIHWLSVLTTEKRHPSAQALLAYLMWRGEHEPLVRKDPQRALALVTVAAENAAAADRVWIEDYYQEIYCGVSSASRKKIDGMITSFRQQYGQPSGSRPLDRRDRSALGGLPVEAVRTCADGERVPAVKRQAQQAPAAVSEAVRETAAQPFARGAMGSAAAPARNGAGFGLMDTGAASPRR